jgi:nucleoid-associated protein YgaU
MLDIKAILATLAGIIVVGGIGAYVYLENSTPEDQVIQVANDPTTSQTAKEETSAQVSEIDSKDEKPEVGDDAESNEAGESSQAETVDAAPDEPTENWKMPAFDVLRVEPDGSTVIAGKGEPNTTLKVMNGDEVLNEVKIGSTGDFAVIFDQPLDSGDYQLTLKVEDEDGNALVSEETAVVSVPEEASGQLLAMITKPGKASRILAQPEAPLQVANDGAEKESEKVEVAANTITAEKTIEAENEVPTVSASESESVETAVSEPTLDKNIENAATSELETTAEKVMEKSEESKDLVAANEPDVSSETSAPTEDAAAAKVVEMAKDEVMENATDAAETVVAVVKEAVKDVDNTAKDAVEVVSKNAEENSVSETPKNTVSQQKNDFVVRIEAVEVEGDRLFVAGVATKGNRVRILVDGTEVGAVDVNGEGRFLIETRQELSVGQHMIAAALENKSTKEIVLQAVVPFNRPEAQSAAAVAASDSEQNAANAVEKPEMKTEMASNAADSQKSEGTNKQDRPVISSSENTLDSKQGNADESMKAADEGSEVTMKNDAANVKVKSETAMASSDTMTKDEPQTIVQDTLTPAASQSVIIRKGDTLWQIARRTYGAGVRYTTIYLANQEQIQNPDKIAPGQIFMVPEEALENAEELHQKRLQGN